MKTLIEKERRNARRRRTYFREAAEEIRDDNLSVAVNGSTFTLCILIGCIAVTPLILTDWRPTVFHLAFVGVMIALCALFPAYRKRSKTRSLTTFFCLLLQAVVVTFGILIDTVAAPGAPAVFVPTIIVALSAVFVFPLWATSALSAFFSLAYAACAVAFKVPQEAQYDVLSALVTFVFAACVAYILMLYRLDIWESRVRYQELSMRDDLSKVLNRRALFAMTESYFRDATEHAPCTLIFIDVDDLKAINDEHGHMVGDAVLRTMGVLLRQSFRSTDIVGRFGGDEFVVFIPEYIQEGTLVEKVRVLRKRFAERTRRELGFAATASVGAVITELGLPEVTDLIMRADEALYTSKHSGKDQITVRHLGLEAA